MTNGTTTLNLETQSVIVSPDGTTTIFRTPKSPETTSAPAEEDPVDPVSSALDDLVTQAEVETAPAATLQPTEEASILTTALETSTTYVNENPTEFLLFVGLILVILTIATWAMLRHLRHRWIEREIKGMSVRGFKRTKSKLVNE